MLYKKQQRNIDVASKQASMCIYMHVDKQSTNIKHRSHTAVYKQCKATRNLKQTWPITENKQWGNELYTEVYNLALMSTDPAYKCICFLWNPCSSLQTWLGINYRFVKVQIITLALFKLLVV